MLERLVRGFQQLPVSLVYGLAGIGKSALATQAAVRWPGQVVFASARAGILLAVVDDVRRRLTRTPREVADSPRARLSDLARLLDEQEALLLLDDAHLLGSADATTLADVLARRLRRGRAVLTSRERIDADPAGPDRLEITLEPLGEAEARELWSKLDALYGEVRGFSRAYARVGGNPFALRRAHQGTPSTQAAPSPLSEAVDAMGRDERFVGRAIALARVPLPSDAVNALLPDGRAIQALLSLRRMLLVDIDGAARCTMHDLVREALLARASDRALQSLHLALAPTLSETPLDPVVRCREEVHHWRAGGEPARAAEVLRRQAIVLQHAGASEELLTAIQSLPSSLRQGPLVSVQGRCLMRMGRAEAAYSLLADAASQSGQDLLAAQLARAQAAMLTGRLSEAETLLQEVTAQEVIPSVERRRADRLRVSLWSLQGRAGALWKLLDRLEAEAATDRERSGVLHLRAFSHWMLAEYPAADLALQQGRALLGEGSLGAAVVGGAITFAALDALLGRVGEAEKILAHLSGDLTYASEEAPSSHAVGRATVLAEQGNRSGAVALLRQALQEHQRFGRRLLEWWVRLEMGRNLLLLGHLREGRAHLQEVASQAVEAGAHAIARAARRDLGWDPLGSPPDESDGGLAPQVFPGSRAHWLAKSCLSSMRLGRWDAAEADLARLEPLASDLPGSGYDRVLVNVARGLLFWRESDQARFEEALDRAREAALEDEADHDFVERAVSCVLGVRGTGDRAGAGDAPVAPAVYDTRRHEVRVDGQTLSLARRFVQRKLLAALARRAGEVVSKERLVRIVWDVEYHPLQHDTTLRVNVLRLRGLLAETSIAIETEEAGYVLRCPGGIRLED